jgi:hypothetical protein
MTHTHISILAAQAVLLRTEVIRLDTELAAVRLESANRLAAMRAALRAEAEGDPDPLGYLRDEIGDYPPGYGGRY